MLDFLEKLVWPSTTIVIVILLREPLSALVRTTQRIKYKDLELEFNQEIAEIAETLPEEVGTAKDRRQISVDLFELADAAPNAALVESWRSVEGAAKALIASRGHDLDYEVPSPYKLIQDVLVRGKMIEERVGRVFEQLRRLRNKVVHADGFEVSVEQAREYVGLAARLRAYLELLRQHPAE